MLPEREPEPETTERELPEDEAGKLKRREMNRAKRRAWEQAEELRDEKELGRLWDID